MWRFVAETEEYLREQGDKNVPPYRLYAMLLAANYSVRWLPEVGDGDFICRMCQRFCYASNESRFQHNIIHPNIPGYTPGVKSNARFSVDIGYVGLNDQHIPSVTKETMELQQKGVIPTTLRLVRIETSWIQDLHLGYRWYLKKHISPSRMKFYMPKYHETTQDDYTSMMVYRVLVEQARLEHVVVKGEYAGQSWKNNVYDKVLYKRLMEVYNMYLKEHMYP
jgi:hypothetical protein